MTTGRQEEMARAVARAQGGDAAAFGLLVRRFQDMAVAYAFSHLGGDVDLAHDAAQEAFVEAHRNLGALRAPAAFPQWLRRIVFKHCDRITRARRVLPALPLEAAAEAVCPRAGPAQVAERRELQRAVREAVLSLPADERVVVTLFYMGQRRYGDIAGFLGVPVSTVKSRLHTARGRLKERMLAMVDDDLGGARPSRGGGAFAASVLGHVREALGEIAAGRGEERYPLAGTEWDTTAAIQLVGHVILWAGERGVKQVEFVPGPGAVQVRFDGAPEAALRLPKSAQAVVAARIRVMAQIAEGGPPEGCIPVRYLRTGKDYDAAVVGAPTAHGEKFTMRISAKAAAPAPAAAAE